MMGINSDIVVLIIVLVLGFLAIKLLAKFVVKLIIILILAAGSFYYVYYHTNFFDKHRDNSIIKIVDTKLDFASIKDLENKFCSKNNQTDNIICECIIAPLITELKQKFSNKDLKNIEKDKAKYIKAILSALNNNKKQIQEKLKKRDATDVWDKVISEVKSGEFLSK